MNFQRIKAMEFAAEKYNIEILSVAGCTVTHKLVDSVETVHKSLWKKMDSIYGVDSKKQYDKNVDLEFSQIQKASGIIENKRDIKKLLRITKRENEDSYISLDTKISDNLYSWKIYSLNEEKYPVKMWNAEYNITVDLNKMEYKINRI